MKITLKHFGVTHSVETEQEHLTATETLDIFCNLMRSIGFHQDSVDEAIMALNEEIDL